MTHSHHEHGHHHEGGGHDHSHGHEHGHEHSRGSRRRLGFAALLTGGFMLAEVVGGLISGSLALLADAGHMLVDFAGLALAYVAIRMAARPANARNTFGYGRLPVLVAFTNGIVLFAIAAFIIVEAARRFASPVEVLATPMLVVAIGGLLVNVVAFFVLHGGDREDLNLRGAFLHVLGDLLGSLAAIAASLTIMATGWTPIDPILSVLVCLIILSNAWRLVRQSAHILLEGAPDGFDTQTLRPALLASVPGLVDVHHVHVWTLAHRRQAATLHARLADETDGLAAVRAIKSELSTRFGISHATVEVEHGECADAALSCHDHDTPHDAPTPHAGQATRPGQGRTASGHGEPHLHFAGLRGATA